MHVYKFVLIFCIICLSVNYVSAAQKKSIFGFRNKKGSNKAEGSTEEAVTPETESVEASESTTPEQQVEDTDSVQSEPPSESQTEAESEVPEVLSEETAGSAEIQEEAPVTPVSETAPESVGETPMGEEVKPPVPKIEEATVPTRPQPEPVAPRENEVHPEVINSLVDNTSGEKSFLEVNDDNYHKEVVDVEGPVALLIYNSDPSDKHSARALLEYEYAARVLKDVIKMVAAEGMQNIHIRSKYQIQGFPMVRLFGVNHYHPIPFQTSHRNESFVKHFTDYAVRVRTELNEIAERNARLALKGEL